MISSVQTAHPREQLRGLAAVLFDMDGTLLDSEKLWDIALDDLAHWLGGELSARARARMVGSSLARSIAIMHDDLGIDADPECSGAFLTERTAELFATSLTWRPGAPELLESVYEAGVPAALVTSTHRRLTETALDFLGREFFAASVCGDEVGHPKPDPEPYLRATQLLDVDPVHCLVIEDSPLGVRAGSQAGCAVLAVPSAVPIPPSPEWTVRESLAGFTVADAADLVNQHVDQLRLAPTATTEHPKQKG